MKMRCLATVGLSLLMLAGCTYEGVRSGLRRDCERMPDSERERCLRRTADTKVEYEAKRRELERSVEGRETGAQQDEPDPRHAEWIP